jgi:hypothetical protein
MTTDSRMTRMTPVVMRNPPIEMVCPVQFSRSGMAPD